MIFLSPYPSVDELRSYYNKTFEYPTGIHNKNELERKARCIVRKMIELRPEGTTFLDIGSGYGYLLDELSHYGVSSTGIEPSYELWKLSAEKEYTVHHGAFEQWSTDETFDYISLVHVIEHVSDPGPFLKKAVKMLRPGGILYIETPNSDSLQMRAENASYTYLTPPDHLRLFSLSALTHLLPNTLVPIILSTYTETEHVKTILKYLVSRKQAVTRPSVPSEVISAPVKTCPAFLKRLKYIALDKLSAPLLSRACNIGGYGSVLELYYQKKP